MTDFDRAILIAGALGLLLLLLQMLLRQRLPASSVPPTVAPMVSPLDEDVRNLRHWRSGVEMALPELAQRVMQQERQIAAVRADLDEIKGGQRRSEHMLNLLLEVGLHDAAQSTRAKGTD